jgi:hypothetical protein
VADERVELPLEPAEQLVGFAVVCERDAGGARCLGETVVDDTAEVAREQADAVARAEERVVAFDHPVDEFAELALHARLHLGLGLEPVARVVRAAADDDPGVVVEVEAGHRRRLEPQAHEFAGLERPGFEKALVFVVGCLVVVASGEQQKWLHPFMLFVHLGRSPECVRV